METYAEYFAHCDKCHSQVLEVLQYMDVENWDENCGVCSKCKKLFCKDCVVEKDWDDIFCPICGSKLVDFIGCSVYDLIAILQHNCQPFTSERETEGRAE